MTNAKTEYDAIVRVRVIGESGSGKSNLLNRFVKNEYTDYFSSGVTEGNKTVTVEGHNVKTLLSEPDKDHRGEVKYENLAKADAIILVCDLSSQASFEMMKQLYNTNLSRFAKDSTPVIIIGNKSDLGNAREVSSDAMKAFVEEHNHNRSLQYFEASAKTGANVNDAFKCAVKEAMYEQKILHRLTGEQHKEIEKMVHLLNPENRKKLPFGLGQKRFEAMAQEEVKKMVNKLGKSEVKAYQDELKKQIPANNAQLTAGEQARFDLSLKLNDRKNEISKAEDTYRSKNRPSGS